MKGVIETAVGIIVLAFLAVLGTSYIVVSLNTQRAQNYHAAVVAEVEASDYADDVIADCREKAETNGYNSLAVEKKESLDGKTYAKVVLDYNYSIPVLGMFMEHEIVGYAR